MTISKTKSDTYRLRLYYPKELQIRLGLPKLYEKTFKTREKAKLAEIDFYVNLKELYETKEKNIFELGGEILFKDFYEEVWLNTYISGLTSKKKTPPTKATISGTKDLFRLHILPMFGKYTLNYLNQNKMLVIQPMTKKAAEYANVKALICYVNSIFDWAEELEYIDRNRLEKSLKRIKAIKKTQLEDSKIEEDLYLTFNELRDWLTAANTDYQKGLLSLQDYVLFQTTFFLSDRKSESYALKWGNVDFSTSQILLNRTLDKFANEKITKGNKKTAFVIPEELKSLLFQWKEQQKIELAQLGIVQTDKQPIFTYVNRKGEFNKSVHIDYLNYKMNSIERRHKNLVHATPRILRHTGATLAKQSGATIEQICEALTHSDPRTTQIYINTHNVVSMAAGEIAYRTMNGG
ncbi:MULTISPECIES: tyrosine-type recombinase/integrase [unclassified Enterococcus]|uniref:tyrosine-type recombinase/integrase n=1 Tax=unclassified Enterococcus TaxID=2608891 RepID=UPI001CE1D67B|nr:MULTISPECIES: site-specific integrase [unclassified Enterococcus]MCA5014388.1 site-specific integrase [Enterococcus sp. S23]MCA5017499.1 site-specific integrase [Enterococcus sp. S22(2020)]